MSASERLQAARRAAVEGRHEQALAEYVWFHHHALEDEPALYGVRLSFALGYWMDLGRDYPEAIRVLEVIRNEKADALLRGDAGRPVFHDVEAINRSLNCTSLTYDLYKRLADAGSPLAAECGQLALPAIVEASDFALAAHLLPDPEGDIRCRAKELERDLGAIKHRAYTTAPVRWALIKNYVDDVQLTLSVLSGADRHSEAARIKGLAVSLLQSPSVRRDIDRGLLRPAKAPVPRRLRRSRRP